MIILVVGLLLILYGFFSKKYSVWVGILFVLLIMGFQEGVPGDYMDYKYIFNIGGIKYDSFHTTLKENEFAFNWVTEIFSKFMNFHLFVLLTSIVQCLAMGLIIKNYAEKKYQYFGVLLIFFNFNIMLLQMKAIRQGYAVDLLLLSFYLLGKRKYYWSILPAVLAYGFHNSSIIAIPFFVVLWVIMFTNSKKKDLKRTMPRTPKNGSLLIPMYVLFVFFVFYFLKYTIFADYINVWIASMETFQYEGYLKQFEERRDISWWILLYHAVSVYLVVLYYTKEIAFFRRYLALLVLVALFLTVGTFGLGDVMRVPMFFICFSIVVFPNVAEMLETSYGKKYALGYVFFNLAYVMYTSVTIMTRYDVNSDGTGFVTYTFSFLNW